MYTKGDTGNTIFDNQKQTDLMQIYDLDEHWVWWFVAQLSIEKASKQLDI